MKKKTALGYFKLNLFQINSKDIHICSTWKPSKLSIISPKVNGLVNCNSSNFVIFQAEVAADLDFQANNYADEGTE